MRRVVNDNLTRLEGKPTVTERSIRWELGVCWVQHLQKQDILKSNSSKGNVEEEIKPELTVKGLGKQLKLLKIRGKKASGIGSKADTGEDFRIESMFMDERADSEELKKREHNGEAEIKKLIPEAAFMRLQETGTDLHQKVAEMLLLTYNLLVHLFRLLIQLLFQINFFI